MGVLISTHEMDLDSIPSRDQRQIYNGMDCCLTFEIWEKAQKDLTENTRLIYNFELAMRAPALEMMLRGIHVDKVKLQHKLDEQIRRQNRIKYITDSLAEAVWGKGLNPNSPPQVSGFFYGAMGIKKVWKFVKGERKLDTGRGAMEKLQAYYYAAPIARCVLAYRDCAKKIGALRSGIDPDGKMRFSFNPSSTESGRWSSSQNIHGSGMNFQNITEELRDIFIPADGMKIAYVDLEQAESRAVGLLSYVLFNDSDYLDACEAGDLHTMVCKMVWKGLAWGSGPDRKIAEEPYYRQFSYRDMAKRGGHGCLTSGHEVLTKTGWQFIESVSETETILIATPDGLEWEEPSAWTHKKWSGTLHKWQGRSVDLEMTSDHRCIFVKDQRSGKWHVDNPANIHRGFLPLGQNYIGGTRYPDARLIAAFQSDGNRKSKNRVCFHLTKQRKIDRLRMLAKEAGYFLHESGDRYVIENSTWPKYAGEYMLGWHEDAIKDFVNEYKFWDGHQGATKNVTLFSVDKEQLEWLQTLGRLVGKGGNFQKAYRSGFGSIVYRLQQNNRLYADIACMNRSTVEVENIDVHCPTVSSGAFLVRHNGKICITGNSNYLGQARTMAGHLQVPVEVMREFQSAYFDAFEGIALWQKWTAQELQLKKKLITPLGRERTFFSRVHDDATIREAVAFIPQSMVADVLNFGLWQVWKKMGDRINLLGQVHDAIVFEYPQAIEAEVLSEVKDWIEVPLRALDRTVTIPCDIECGWNWQHASKNNPDGLKKWTGHDERIPQENPHAAILDRRLY